MTFDDQAEDLSDEQIDELKADLARLRAEVESALETAKEDAKPVDLGLSIGRITRVDALQQQHMATSRRNRLQDQHRQVQSAERRIQEGTYGECVRCELPIGYARLKARPETPFCRRCQAGS